MELIDPATLTEWDYAEIRALEKHVEAEHQRKSRNIPMQTRVLRNLFAIARKALADAPATLEAGPGGGLLVTPGAAVVLENECQGGAKVESPGVQFKEDAEDLG